MAKQDQSSVLLFLIALGKLGKAALLFTVAAGAHHLLHKNVEEVVLQWAHAVRVDPHNEYVHAAISKATGVNDARLKAISLGTFLYGTLFLTEGIGLLARRRWAEWLTVVSTALLLPLEAYEIHKKVTAVRIIVLLLNALIVVYLIVRLRHKTAEPEAAGIPAKALAGDNAAS